MKKEGQNISEAVWVWGTRVGIRFSAVYHFLKQFLFCIGTRDLLH